jgi:hypothetical protein
MLHTCDKCGEAVPDNNNASVLEIYLGNFSAILAWPRHLLPTENCEGSPSRAQYLEGQPKDPRSKYGYHNFHEQQVRAAYETMQLQEQPV